MNAPGVEKSRALPSMPGPARLELRSILERAEWPGDVECVLLAVHEALINSQRHAGGAVSANVCLDGMDVVVEVRDDGPGFSIERHARRRPAAMAERGRGLWLISRIADSWDVREEDGLTCFSLRFRP